MKTPRFWYEREGRDAAPKLRALLTPFSWAYAASVRRRFAKAEPFDPSVPVICVGNATAGGTGKTPVVLYLIASLRRLGIEAHALSRGHGGTDEGPTRIGVRHGADEVGDEALLLGSVGPAWVARKRAQGAVAAVNAGARVIVMDDGHQNPDLVKSLNLLVVDAEVGFGNGRVIPAGPLREPVDEALARADAVILTMPRADFDPAPELIEQLETSPSFPPG